MKKKLGQFYTPEPVADWMVHLFEGKKNSRIFEPGFGEGAFLFRLLQNGYKNVSGCDVDRRNVEKVARFFPGYKLEHKSFLAYPRKAEFDLIIGNPPYVQWRNIPTREKQILEENSFWKKRSNGQWDLSYAFLLQSLQMLREGGEMIFILPINWFYSTYAFEVREELEKGGSFLKIYSFGEAKIFPDCDPETIVFHWKKGVKPRDFEVTELVHQDRRQDKLYADFNKRSFEAPAWRRFQSAPLRGDTWSLHPKELGDSLLRLENDFSTIAQHFQVGVGMVSGLEKAFLLPSDLSVPTSEKNGITKLIKAKGCAPLARAKAQKLILIRGIGTEKELRQKYPVLSGHLRSYKQELLSRFGGKPWWEWATPRNEELFRGKEKLVFPAIDRSTIVRVCLAQKSELPAGDVVGVVGDELLYLMGWLSSDIFSEWFSAKGPQSGGRRKYTQAYLEKVPYPLGSKKQIEEVKDLVQASLRRREKPRKELNRLFRKIIR